MKHLAERPLGYLAAAFAGGIALANTQKTYAFLYLGGLGIALAVFCALQARRFLGFWLTVVIAALLGAVALLQTQLPSEMDISHLPTGGQTIIGTVADVPQLFGAWQTFVLQAEKHIDIGFAPHRNGIPAATTKKNQLSGRLFVILHSTHPIQRGERLRLTGELRPIRLASNPGQKGEDKRLASLGVNGVFTVASENLCESLGDGKLSIISQYAYVSQKSALTSLEKHVPGIYNDLGARIAASVVFGLHAAPPPKEIATVFRQAGTIHLLVVSGAMVSMVFGLVFFPGMIGLHWRRAIEERSSGIPLAGRGHVRLRPGAIAALLAIITVSYYALLTEGGQAVLRAAVMGILIALALLLRRFPQVARTHGLNIDSYTLVAAAALVVLIASPQSLFQAGFQLSFTAVLAILYLTPKMTWALTWLPKSVAQLFAGTIAAQLGTFPLLIWHFGQAPIAGFGANLLAVPLASLVLIGAICTCASSAIMPWLAVKAGWITGLATKSLVWVSSVFANLPAAQVEVRLKLGWIIACYGALVLAGWCLENLRKRWQQPIS